MNAKSFFYGFHDVDWYRLNVMNMNKDRLLLRCIIIVMSLVDSVLFIIKAIQSQ